MKSPSPKDTGLSPEVSAFSYVFVTGFPRKVDGYHCGLPVLVTGHPGKEARSLMYPCRACRFHLPKTRAFARPNSPLPVLEVPRLAKLHGLPRMAQKEHT